MLHRASELVSGFTPTMWSGLGKVWMLGLQPNTASQIPLGVILCAAGVGEWWNWKYKNFYHEHAQPLEDGPSEAVGSLPLEVFPTSLDRA